MTGETARDFLVCWSIDESAATPKDAARSARRHQCQGSSATVFVVHSADAEPVTVDLLEIDGPEQTPALEDRLQALIADGLQFHQALKGFVDQQLAQEPHLSAYAEAANDTEILNHESIVSWGDDGGAWVLSWSWVSDEQAGLEAEDQEEDDDAPRP